MIYIFKSCWCACLGLFSNKINNIVNCSMIHHPLISQVPDQNSSKRAKNTWVTSTVRVSISSDQVSVSKYQFHLKWFWASWRNNWFWIKFWETLWTSVVPEGKEASKAYGNMSRKHRSWAEGAHIGCIGDTLRIKQNKTNNSNKKTLTLMDYNTFHHHHLHEYSWI